MEDCSCGVSARTASSCVVGLRSGESVDVRQDVDGHQRCSQLGSRKVDSRSGHGKAGRAKQLDRPSPDGMAKDGTCARGLSGRPWRDSFPNCYACGGQATSLIWSWRSDSSVQASQGTKYIADQTSGRPFVKRPRLKQRATREQDENWSDWLLAGRQILGTDIPQSAPGQRCITARQISHQPVSVHGT